MWRTFFLLAWIPFFGQPSWGQPPGIGVQPGQKQPKNGRRTTAATTPRGTDQNPFVVDTQGHKQTDIERDEANKQAAKTETGEQYHRYIDRWALIWNGTAAVATAVLVLIGIGGVCAALKTLRAINRQADLQERTIRPWIGTDFILPGTVLEISGRLEITANISLKNTGPSVALDGIMLPHLISSRAAALPNDIKDAWIRTETQLVARNNTEWETGFVLHPTRSHTHESVMGGSMPYSDMEARLCYVLVCVIYRDQFGKEHRTQDCFNIRTQGLDVPANGIAFTAVPAHQKAT